MIERVHTKLPGMCGCVHTHTHTREISTHEQEAKYSPSIPLKDICINQGNTHTLWENQKAQIQTPQETHTHTPAGAPSTPACVSAPTTPLLLGPSLLLNSSVRLANAQGPRPERAQITTQISFPESAVSGSPPPHCLGAALTLQGPAQPETSLGAAGLAVWTFTIPQSGYAPSQGGVPGLDQGGRGRPVLPRRPPQSLNSHSFPQQELALLRRPHDRIPAAQMLAASTSSSALRVRGGGSPESWLKWG